MPQGVFTFEKFDVDKREKYFGFLRRGIGKTKAAHGIGVSHELVCAYRRAFPEFADEEKHAIEDSLDAVEGFLWNAAEALNVTACQVILYNQRSDRWRDQRGAAEREEANKLRALLEELKSERAGRTKADGQGGTATAGGGQEPADANLADQIPD